MIDGRLVAYRHLRVGDSVENFSGVRRSQYYQPYNPRDGLIIDVGLVVSVLACVFYGIVVNSTK